MEGIKGAAVLYEALSLGIKVIGVYPSGATVAKDGDYKKSFTNDINFVKQEWWIKEDLRMFYFFPRDAGLLCLDIDCKNGKDGLAGFWDFCKKQGKSRDSLPSIFKDFPNNFPCYVRTPNDGYHLYFKSDQIPSSAKLLSCLPDGKGVDVRFGQTLAAPGSYKDGKPYVLFGNIAKAPQLPEFIMNKIVQPTKPIAQGSGAMLYRDTVPAKKKITAKTTRDWVIRFAEKDYANYMEAGRNNRAYGLACTAKKHKYTYDEALDVVLSDPSVNTLGYKELQGVVKSVYKHNRYEIISLPTSPIAQSQAKWEDICRWVDQDNAINIAGKIDHAINLAYKARVHGWKQNETLVALEIDPSVSNLDYKELQGAVKRVYNYKFM